MIMASVVNISEVIGWEGWVFCNQSRDWLGRLCPMWL